MTALAVDGGNAYQEKRDVQNTADNTALGAAISRIKNNNTWVDEAYSIANKAGYDNNGESNIVKIYSPPITGLYVGDIEYIQVLITHHVPTFFGSVIGVDEVVVSGEAISRTTTPEIKEIFDGNALISLAPTSDCQNKRSFWVHGEATISLSGGGIFVNSDNPDCALITYGSGSIRIEEGFDIELVGGADIQKPKSITPYPPNTGNPSIPYPPPLFMPKVGCTTTATIMDDGETLSPGSWGDGNFPPENIKHLSSGVYCVENDFILNANSTLEGNGVLIVVPNGMIRMNGSSNINLKAMYSENNPLSGLLIYAPIENQNTFTFAGSAESSLKGLILAPGANIRITGGYEKTGIHSQIISRTFEADGNSDTQIIYKDEDNWDTFSMPQIELIK